MIYSPTSQYSLRALIHLALKEGKGPVLVRDIAEIEAIPKQFLSKILHGLRNKGLVISTKGPGGGYQLARPATKITVREVIETIEGDQDLSKRCILGLDACNDKLPCALHDSWKVFRTQYTSVIGVVTLAEAAKTLGAKRDIVR